MAATVYSVRRLGPLWGWRITQGAAAPARGLAFSEGGARTAARNRIRHALQRLDKLEPPAPEPGPFAALGDDTASALGKAAAECESRRRR